MTSHWGAVASALNVAVISSSGGLQPKDSDGLQPVKVAGIVVRWIRFGDYKEANYDRVSRLIREAAKQGAKIICTTECFLDGYHVEVSDQEYNDVHAYLEDVATSAYVGRLKALAKALDVYIVAGMAVADPDRKDADGNPCPFNASQLYSPEGELVGRYYKTHNFGKRSPWFEAVPDCDKIGCFPSFSTNFGRVGSMICNDRIFAETTHWLTVSGAQLILCPTGGDLSYEMLRDRSRETGVGVVWVHPCGFAATAPGGEIITASILDGRTLDIPADEVGGPTDHQEVFYVHMPLSSGK